MHISLTNIDNQKQSECRNQHRRFKAKDVTGRVLTSKKVQDHNTFENPIAVVPQNFDKAKFSDDNIVVNMPPNSVIILELDE